MAREREGSSAQGTDGGGPRSVAEPAPGDGRAREVSPSGHGGEAQGGVRVGAGLLVSTPSSLLSVSQFLLHFPVQSPMPVGRPRAIPVREGVGTAQDANGSPAEPRQGWAGGHAVLEAQEGQTVGTEWPQGLAGA